MHIIKIKINTYTFIFNKRSLYKINEIKYKNLFFLIYRITKKCKNFFIFINNLNKL